MCPGTSHGSWHIEAFKQHLQMNKWLHEYQILPSYFHANLTNLTITEAPGRCPMDTGISVGVQDLWIDWQDMQVALTALF